MKIQCDLCNKEEASVFCSADEAALCGGCDRGVHHANKLASKHIRFSLQQPSNSSTKEYPSCDICQERRAILFCQEDRAILCRECDIPIHKANEHTQKHNRFLLTGDRLSSSSLPTSSSSINGRDLTANSDVKSTVSNQSSTNKPLPSTSTNCRDNDQCMSQDNSVSTRSTSEYLMETLPGWQMDDFLDPSCPPNGFCKFLYHDLGSNLYPFPSDDMVIWIPQAPKQSSHIPLCLTQPGVMNGLLKGS